ncbi:hypothetical protein BST26_11070 [Mycolicibacterium insubricum]|uniref:Protein kinase domain-containing protein n=1 Tax=Mycolicibacterium insubricum TaxID=444597 RepID=A0A1X0DEX1_9MYCO|nr:hypothetical protein BST26_11070 [Mycolicibacterium insubricum]
MRTVLTQSGRLAPERAVAVVTQIAGELATGHSEGIPYRAAISPNEIILTAEGAAHLTTASTDDAGVAVAANDIDQVAYMAPERLLAKAAPSQRTEVYALAGVLYECLTGTTLLRHRRPSRTHRSVTDRPGSVPKPARSRTTRSVRRDPHPRTGKEPRRSVSHRRRPGGRRPGRPGRTRPGRCRSPVPMDTCNDTGTAETPDPSGPAGITSHPRTASGTDPRPTSTPPSPDADHGRRRTRRTLAIVAAVAVAAAVVAAVVGVLTVKVSQPGIPAWGAQQRELPFGQLHGPRGVAVDTAGNVFVIDFDRDRISSHQRGRVLKLAAGADHPTELPFPDLDFPNGIAVDATGSVYVTGGNAEQLSMLKPETTTPTPVFTGITLNGVAVDSGGNVYASDAISRVWRLTAGTDELAALHIEQDPSGVAVDTAGAVYITVTNGTSDGGQVLRLAES